MARATNVTIEHFPELIKQLYDATFTAEHLQTAFRAAGLAPFNPNVNHPTQVAPSLPTSGTSEGIVSVCSETPLCKELRVMGDVSEILKPTEGAAQRQKRQMVKVNSVVEVIMSDKVLERLEQVDAEKAKKKRSKKDKKDQRKDEECDTV